MLFFGFSGHAVVLSYSLERWVPLRPYQRQIGIAVCFFVVFLFWVCERCDAYFESESAKVCEEEFPFPSVLPVICERKKCELESK